MQNSIVIKKPKDTKGFQIKKDGANLSINYFQDGNLPSITHSKYGTVTIGGALTLAKFTDFPNNPVNGMLIMLETTPAGAAPEQELWCYLNNSWGKIAIE